MSQLKIKDDNDQWINIPASGVGVPSGGTTGQVLQKSSDTDYATQWVTPQNMVLLWENSISEYAEYPPTTLNLDLTGFNYVLVLYTLWVKVSGDNTSYAFMSNLVPVGEYGHLASNESYRRILAASGGVVIGDGYLSAASGSVTKNNNACIPRKIYGVRI